MEAGDIAWVLGSSALVLFMTPGLALFYGGMDRSRNVLNMLMMNFWCLLIVPIVWVAVGFSLAYAGKGSFIGNFDWAFLNDLGIGEDTDGGHAARRGHLPRHVRRDHARPDLGRRGGSHEVLRLGHLRARVADPRLLPRVVSGSTAATGWMARSPACSVSEDRSTSPAAP